jgi:hypothetical protein
MVATADRGGTPPQEFSQQSRMPLRGTLKR